ncbi:response regulator [Candidatus Bathyarchaeota archaeon]|nr:response regulator [Candidatus Bathyarchaeota archaeon]
MVRRASVLVVDDDAAIRRTLSRILEKEGYLVEAVESGGKAVEVSAERFFNVALIDIRLPDMEGTELLEKLKRTEPKMVKIIVTGYPSLKNAVEAVNKGADGYVLKPFDAGELLAMIEEHLKRQRETMKYSDEKVAEYIETRVREVELEKQKHRVH